MMKKAALYLRVSTIDQNAETQLHDLRAMAAQRNLAIVKDYCDSGFSGARVKRPALDQMMADARRGQFQVVLVWACDRLARSSRHLLELLDEFNRLHIEFLSFREALDTSGPLGRAVTTIVAAVSELERSLIIERVKAGMRRAKLEGRRLGRKPLELDREQIMEDRHVHKYSLGHIAKVHRISKTTVIRVLDEAGRKSLPQVLSAGAENKGDMQPESAA